MDTLLNYGSVIVLGGIVLYILKALFGKRAFAYLMSKLTVDENAPLAAMKADFFKDLSSLKSRDSKRKKRNALRILEIGVGTGMNFKYYPEGTDLVVIDPNPYFKSYYDEKRRNFPNIQSEEIIVAKGEDMNMISSNSVDVVVVTLVMCSVEAVEEALKEIHRVLVPGGKFYFWEHIKEFKPEVHYMRAFIQKFLTNTGIFPFFFDGCQLTRDMSMQLQTIGFGEISSKRVHTPQKGWLTVIAPHIIGTATK